MIEIINCDLFKANCNIKGHQVNCRGTMGKTGGKDNVALQMRKNFPIVYDEYCRLYNYYDDKTELLGMCQLIYIGEGNTEYVANLFGQNNYGNDGALYTDYDALRKSLTQLHKFAKLYPSESPTIAIPYKMGCCRGGGDWHIVYDMLQEEFGDSNVKLYICKLEKGVNQIVSL